MQLEVKQYLEQYNITPLVHEHPPVFTVEEAAVHCQHIPGMPCKNLFLKEKETKDTKYYLIIMNAHKRLQINNLAKLLNLKKLTFANGDELFHYLKLKPGSVSPLGLINDQYYVVKVIIDEEVWHAPIVNFHPNINTASLEFTQEQFHNLMNTFQNEKKIIPL